MTGPGAPPMNGSVKSHLDCWRSTGLRRRSSPLSARIGKGEKSSLHFAVILTIRPQKVALLLRCPLSAGRRLEKKRPTPRHPRRVVRDLDRTSAYTPNHRNRSFCQIPLTCMRNHDDTCAGRNAEMEGRIGGRIWRHTGHGKARTGAETRQRVRFSFVKRDLSQGRAQVLADAFDLSADVRGRTSRSTVDWSSSCTTSRS